MKVKFTREMIADFAPKGRTEMGEVLDLPEKTAKSMIGQEFAVATDELTEAEQKAKDAAPNFREVIVPSFEEVKAAGYSDDAANGIVKKMQAKADAVKANPNITEEELAKVGETQDAK